MDFHVLGKASPGFSIYEKKKDALNNAHPYVVVIYFVTLHKHAHVCWRLPVIVYSIRYMLKLYVIYICPQTLYMWHRKVTTSILHDTPCHLVKSSYLVYCTVISGHPPQDVDILWIISVSNVFCLLLVRPLSMSSNTFVNGARMSGVCAFIVGYFEYEHKTLLIHRPATLIFRIYLCGIVCITIKQPTQWLNVMPILFLTSTSWYIHVYMVNNNIHWAENLSELRVCP